MSALAAATPAWAQPVDPYGEPVPTPTAPGAADPEIELAVAQALVARARVLTGEGAHADAKQLVVEALVRRPGDPEATALLAELNRKLGIVDPPVAAPADLRPPESPRPIADEPLPEPPPTGEGRRPDAVVRYAAGVGGGAVAGGLFADVVSGLDDTSSGDILGGVLIGAVVGGGAAYLLERDTHLTVGDHALIGSLATWGLVGGLTFGLAIDPPEGEAYSLNGVVGIVGGYVVGHVAARQSDVSTRRMLRVNAAALIGAAAPWLLYAAASDPDSNDDEQAFGFLSTVGLLGGAYLGFRWTRGMAPGSEVDRARGHGPTALLMRDEAGWRVGGIGGSRAMGGGGLVLTVAGGAW